MKAAERRGECFAQRRSGAARPRRLGAPLLALSADLGTEVEVDRNRDAAAGPAALARARA